MAKEVQITPFRLFDAQARNAFKRKLVARIQNSLALLDLDDGDFPAIVEDAAIANRIIKTQIHPRPRQ
jgi:hypothetical protein